MPPHTGNINLTTNTCLLINTLTFIGDVITQYSNVSSFWGNTESWVIKHDSVKTVWFLSAIRPTDPNRRNNQTHTCFGSNLFGNKAPMQSLHGITQTYKHTHTHSEMLLYVTLDSCFIYLSHSSITMRKNCHILFHSETPCYWFLCTRNKATSVFCNASRLVTA